MSPETYQTIHQVSRFLFALGGILILLSAIGWLVSETHDRKKKHRSLSGNIGELVVISGNDEMPAQTWFPLPREGVLGSVRSCDLVVPADGVSTRHLDFCWQDGIGLLIRPRSGCEVMVNGMILNCKSDPESAPLIHGSSLQIGSAILRLHLLAALDHTSTSRSSPELEEVPDLPPVPVPEPDFAVPSFPGNTAVYIPSPSPLNTPGVLPFPETQPEHIPVPVYPAASSEPSSAEPAPFVPVQPDPAAVPGNTPVPESSFRPRRSDRWKEDWSE